MQPNRIGHAFAKPPVTFSEIRNQAVRRITNTVSELKNALLPPNTKPATFAAPIYAPKTKVEPKRSIVILVGLVAGGFLGLLLLVGVRVRNNIRKQLQAA